MGIGKFQLGRRIVALVALATVCSAAASDPARPATLVVTIVVDQYSTDLFGEYRSRYRHGLATLTKGVVFPNGYQSHATTETCPGHATILTGARPARTGIVANGWQGRDCVKVPSKNGKPVVSPQPLLVPTLGDRLRDSDANSRTVAIGGKDRAAVMLGGKKSFLTLWWQRGKGFVTYANATVDARMQAQIDVVNESAKAMYESAQRSQLPRECMSRSHPVTIEGSYTVGVLHETQRSSSKWRATPAFDDLTLEMAKAAVDTLELGRRKSVDVLAVSFSATDYAGHYFGTAGAEMCVQQFALDRIIEELLTHLDRKGLSYVVALTADHGGLDIPERNNLRGVPQASRLSANLWPKNIGAEVARRLNLKEPILLGGSQFTNDIYLAPSIGQHNRSTVLEAVRKEYERHVRDQVAAVFSRSELDTARAPSGPPDQWSLLDRAKAGFNAKRSGDLVVFLKPYVTKYGKPTNVDEHYTASHGSPWDYDRRVPIIFWWPDVEGFEQPAAVETVDIAPTLAALIGLRIEPHEMDGRVLPIRQARN